MGLDVGVISFDGCFIVLLKNNLNKDSDVFIFDMCKKIFKLEFIICYDDDVKYGLEIFLRDSKLLYYLIDVKGEFV